MLELEEVTLRLDHYHFQYRLRLGGMSEVYRAYDKRFQRIVAIKIVESDEVEQRARFQREIQTISNLRHPHILPILDYGEHSTRHYLVMPYIEQGTLRDRLAKRPLTEEEAGIILEQLSSALQFMHDRGIIHRDIKPSNILLENGPNGLHAYLADFGLVKVMGERSDITQTGCLMGTPEYMSPELAYEPPSTSSDIYALGVLLYRALTGQLPFRAEHPVAIYWKHIHEQPVRPSQLNPAISYPVEQVILRAMEKHPGHRYKSAQAVAQAYNRALRTPKVLAVGTALVHHFLRKLRTTQSVPEYSPALVTPSTRTIPQISRALRPRPAASNRAFAAIIALFFVLIGSLSLIFSVLYSNSLAPQTPRMLGSSVQFNKVVHSGSTPPTPQSVIKNQSGTTPPQHHFSQGKPGGGHKHSGHKHGGHPLPQIDSL